MRIFLPAIAALLSLLSMPAAAQGPNPQEGARRAMTFAALDTAALCADCSVVQASGSIETDTVKAYYDFIWRSPFRKNVYFILDSPGGSMKAALRLGEIMRNLKVNTVVGRAFVRDGEVEIEPGRCASACVFAFLGGATRSMPKDSKLGVHSWMPISLLEQGNRTTKPDKPPLLSQAVIEELHRQTAVYLKFLETMGVDLRLAGLTLRTPYRRMAWISPRDQSLWSVVTVDSRLSTPADRRFPVLFLPQTASSAPVGESKAQPQSETSL